MNSSRLQGLDGMTKQARPQERPRMKDVPRDMEQYFVGLLSKGERWNDTEGAEAADLIPRHLAYIRKQVEAGHYLLAGPITGDSHLTGLLIIAGKTAEEALAIAKGDPGVQAGRLSVEVHPVLLPSLNGIKVNFS
jgi:uncharacterized protein YciI